MLAEEASGHIRWLVVINPQSGTQTLDYQAEIARILNGKQVVLHFFTLLQFIQPTELRQEIEKQQPDIVVAVGGDGTLKLVAESIIGLPVGLGIIPTGSANGLARDLGIGGSLVHCLDILLHGKTKKIHLTRIQNEWCIHLADVGLNAFMVKKFEQNRKRGMFGYFVAGIQAFLKRYRMQLQLEIDGQTVHLHAFMLVIANASRYGTGAWINPVGRLDDDLFEVVVIRRISIWEGIRLALGLKTWEPRVIRVFQTRKFKLKSRKSVHFQIDGEYLGKIKELQAEIYPEFLEVIVPS